METIKVIKNGKLITNKRAAAAALKEMEKSWETRPVAYDRYHPNKRMAADEAVDLICHRIREDARMRGYCPYGGIHLIETLWKQRITLAEAWKLEDFSYSLFMRFWVDALVASE